MISTPGTRLSVLLTQLASGESEHSFLQTNIKIKGTDTDNYEVHHQKNQVSSSHQNTRLNLVLRVYLESPPLNPGYASTNIRSSLVIELY